MIGSGTIEVLLNEVFVINECFQWSNIYEHFSQVSKKSWNLKLKVVLSETSCFKRSHTAGGRGSLPTVTQCSRQHLLIGWSSLRLTSGASSDCVFAAVSFGLLKPTVRLKVARSYGNQGCLLVSLSWHQIGFQMQECFSQPHTDRVY